jgi:DNA polymerase (family X)
MNAAKELAALFTEMADLLEIRGVDWKPRAYRAAAQSLSNLDPDLAEIHRKKGLRGLEEIPGIGEGLGKKIIEYLQTGRIREHEKLRQSLPGGRALLRVPGWGPYRAENLHHHHIESVGGLKRAVREQRLSRIPGFGPVDESRIGRVLGQAKPRGERKPRREVLPRALRLLSALRRIPGVDRAELAGSLRRREAMVGDIDLLAVSRNPGAVQRAFTAIPLVGWVVQRGPRKSQVVLRDGLQADLRICAGEDFGAAMVYFTGNKLHNIQLRRRAKARGW